MPVFITSACYFLYIKVFWSIFGRGKHVVPVMLERSEASTTAANLSSRQSKATKDLKKQQRTCHAGTK